VATGLSLRRRPVLRGSTLIAGMVLSMSLAGAAHGQASARLASPPESLSAALPEAAGGAGRSVRPADLLHRAAVMAPDAPFQSAPGVSSAPEFDASPTSTGPLSAGPLSAIPAGAAPADDVLLGASTGGLSPAGGWDEINRPSAEQAVTRPDQGRRPSAIRR
jgi:hypothetical protein